MISMQVEKGSEKICTCASAAEDRPSCMQVLPAVCVLPQAFATKHNELGMKVSAMRCRLPHHDLAVRTRSRILRKPKSPNGMPAYDSRHSLHCRSRDRSACCCCSTHASRHASTLLPNNDASCFASSSTSCTIRGHFLGDLHRPPLTSGASTVVTVRSISFLCRERKCRKGVPVNASKEYTR